MPRVHSGHWPTRLSAALDWLVRETSGQPCDVVANPDFMKEGTAIDDFLRPDRVIIGCEDVRVREIMRELYSPFVRTGKPVLMMGRRSAEMAKYATNLMLAARISRDDPAPSGRRSGIRPAPGPGRSFGDRHLAADVRQLESGFELRQPQGGRDLAAGGAKGRRHPGGFPGLRHLRHLST